MKRKCESCNQEFETRDAKRYFRRFCSKECRSKAVPSWLRRKKDLSELTKDEKHDQYRNFFYRDVIIKEGCWGWKGFLDKDGYSRVICRTDYGPGRASRASWIIHKGEIPKGMIILHECDNRECTNPQHLRLGTYKENSLNMVFKNRQANGSKNGNSKLDEIQVKEIKSLILEGLSYPKIAKLFGVGSDAISNIKRGITWKHVEV